jgi:hypothetical protein
MIEKKDTNEEDFKDQTEKIIGAFLPRILHLENLMKDIMSRHFCSHDDERGTAFFYSIAPQMSFREKINIFVDMLKTSYDDIYKTYESDLEKLYEIDQYRKDLERLLLNSSVNVLDKDEFDSVQSRECKKGESRREESMKKEHELKVGLCTQITTTLKIIQRDIIMRGYGP